MTYQHFYTTLLSYLAPLPYIGDSTDVDSDKGLLLTLFNHRSSKAKRAENRRIAETNTINYLPSNIFMDMPDPIQLDDERVKHFQHQAQVIIDVFEAQFSNPAQGSK